MLWSMGGYGTGSGRACKRRIKDGAHGRGVTGGERAASFGKIDLAPGGCDVQPENARRVPLERVDVRAQRPQIAAGHRSREGGPDAEGAGVAERSFDQRPVDRERAGLVEACDATRARRSRRGARRSRRRQGPRPRDTPTSNPERGGPPSRRSPRPSGRAGRRAGRHPRSPPSRRAEPPPPVLCRQRRPADGRRRSESLPPSPARAPRHRAPRSCGPSPGRCTSGAMPRPARSRRRGPRG